MIGATRNYSRASALAFAMEQSGMRWTNAGAQAVLDLRSVRLNGQWDAY